MLKKKSSQKPSCLKKRAKPSIQCSVCNCSSTTTAFYVCDSGHIMCENCRKSDGSESRRDGGDTAFNSLDVIQRNTQPIKDLSSGDCDKNKACSNKKDDKRKVNNECKINIFLNHEEIRAISEKNNDEKPEPETVIEYKNANYTEDKSSVCSLIKSDSEHAVEFITEMPPPPISRVCPRWYHYLILQFAGPVKCPVEECSKMIALDSVMLHFYFDHSKIPRATLNGCAARQIQIKPSSLYAETHCLTIFLLQESNEVKLCTTVDSGALISGNYSDCKSLLLMAAKIQAEKYKKTTAPVQVRDVYTQTDILHKCLKNKKSKATEFIIKSMPYESVSQKRFEDNETLLLWLCKQDDNTTSYSISVLRQDKRQGHSYIGEAIHIRSDQTPAAMLKRSECLIMNGTALNRLLDENDQITVYIEVLA